jgi:GNAT superfamily N-acetyltransferase
MARFILDARSPAFNLPGRETVHAAAVDRRAQGLDIGASLLQDAVNRAVAVSQNAGVRALLVHALHERAGQFYEHYGFQPSPMDPLTLMLRLSAVKV